MCWSRAIFTLQHLPLSSPKKVQQLLGSPPTEDLIYPHGCIAWALRSTWTSYRKPQPESVRGRGNLHPADRFQSQTPPQRQGPGQAFFISWKPGVSDLINPKKAVRDGPCREGWPKLWFLSGQGSPSRTNRKRSLSIMYSHWEQVNSPLFSSKYWIQDLKLVLAECDPKIKSNGMSLLIRSLEIWFGWIFRLKCWIPPRVSHWFFSLTILKDRLALDRKCQCWFQIHSQVQK